MLTFLCGVAVGAGIIAIIVATIVAVRYRENDESVVNIVGELEIETFQRMKAVSRLEEETVLLNRRIELTHAYTDISVKEHEAKFHAPVKEAQKSPRKDTKPKK